MRTLRLLRTGDVRYGRRTRRRFRLAAIGGVAMMIGVAPAGDARAQAKPRAEPVRRPAPAAIRYAPRGLPARRVGAAVRGESGLSIVAVAPKDHLPETASAHPALYWRSLRPIDRAIERITLTFTDVANQHTQEIVLPGPAVTPRAGDLQRVRTDSLWLEPGREYLWRIRVELTDGAAGTDAAYLRRRATTIADSGDALARARSAAADGRWYDAVSPLADSAAASPRSGLRLIRDRFLRTTTGASR